MTETTPTVAIVFGWNYSTTLGIVRSLGLAGLTVDLYYIAKAVGDSRITASSKYLRRTVEHIGRDDEVIVADLENRYGGEDARCVLIPTDDYTASLVDRYYGRLSARFLMPHIGVGEEGALTHLMDKSVQSAIACSFDIGLPPGKRRNPDPRWNPLSLFREATG